MKAECLKLPRPPLDDPTKAILWTTPIYRDQRLNCYLFHLQRKNDNDSCYSCFTEDPTALFQYPRSSPDAVLKFVTDIFSSRDTSEFFYALDMKVLIEIVLRQMADLSPGAGVGLYLSALYLSFYIFISILHNPSNNFACARLLQTYHVAEYSLVKTGKYPVINPSDLLPKRLKSLFRI